MANNLKRFDPFNDLARSDTLRGMEDFMKNFRLRSMFGDGDAEPVIKIDVTEDDQKYEVKADIPGVNKEDINIDINGNEVAISAEMRRENEAQSSGAIVRSERYYGRQYRSFTLAHEINEADASARYENGVLQLTLPKKPGGKGKKVVIN